MPLLFIQKHIKNNAILIKYWRKNCNFQFIWIKSTILRFESSLGENEKYQIEKLNLWSTIRWWCNPSVMLTPGWGPYKNSDKEKVVKSIQTIKEVRVVNRRHNWSWKSFRFFER